MDDKNQIDDLVSMIDNFMAGKGGHMNVTTNEAIKETTEQTTNSLECAEGDMACKVPTLHQGLDGSEE